MKSERRHQLQQNSLASSVPGIVQFLRNHGSKILLVIILILIATILMIQHSRRKQEQLQVGWANVTEARVSIERLGQSAMTQDSPADQLTRRKSLVAAINNALNQVLASDDRQLAAEAYLVRGDLNWTLANLPEIPGAATQPSLQLEASGSDYLGRAQESYSKVTQAYADQPSAVVLARFKLASVHENKREFDAAQKLYDAIRNNANTTPSYKVLAEYKLAELAKIRKPVYLAPGTSMAELTATQPASTTPSEQPATAPAK